MKKKGFLKQILAAAGLAILAALPLTAAADGGRFDCTTSRDENNNICVSFSEVQVLLPSSWAGKCQVRTSDDYVSFYQTKSRELWTEELGYENGGLLFTLCYSENYEEDTRDIASDGGIYYVGEGVSGTYYVTQPTDYQAYEYDQNACLEFNEMSANVEWIKNNISITASGDYIFPQSSDSYLSESDLAGMDADGIQMAINEIYARHHRKFLLDSVQEYFDSRSWYDGYIEADDFDPSVMNQYESANINLMVNVLATR